MRILILIFLLALSITANAECEVNGYYRADGTWVDGYTRSGDCWNGKVIGYDAQGRSADERQKIRVEKNRILIPIALAVLFLLLLLLKRVKEGGLFDWIFGWGSFLLGGYILFGVTQDPILLGISILIIFIWYKYFRKQNKKESISISETDENSDTELNEEQFGNDDLFGDSYLSQTEKFNGNSKKVSSSMPTETKKLQNNEVKEITYNSSQIVAECNTINTVEEFHRILKKINFMYDNNSFSPSILNSKLAVIIQNTNGGAVEPSQRRWTEKGKKYLLEIINSDIKLNNKLNLEFIDAKDSVMNYSDTDPRISRELAVELFRGSKRKLIFNDESYTTFTFDRFGILINKFDGIADKCYLVNKKGAIFYGNNKDVLDDYFYGSCDDSEYDEPEYEGDEDGTVNGKVYLADGVWIDRKDVWW